MPTTKRKPSQSDKILRLLQRRPGVPVSNWDLAEASGSLAIHSRIAELRARGHDIECIRSDAHDRPGYYYILHA